MASNKFEMTLTSNREVMSPKIGITPIDPDSTWVLVEIRKESKKQSSLRMGYGELIKAAFAHAGREAPDEKVPLRIELDKEEQTITILWGDTL